jgi:hypothetical protein
LYYSADVEFIFGLAIAEPSYQMYLLLGDGLPGLVPLSDVHDFTVLADRYYLLRWARGMSTEHYFAPPPSPSPDEEQDGHDYVDRILEKRTVPTAASTWCAGRGTRTIHGSPHIV